MLDESADLEGLKINVRDKIDSNKSKADQNRFSQTSVQTAVSSVSISPNDKKVSFVFA